jgi:hypothetical protein
VSKVLLIFATASLGACLGIGTWIAAFETRLSRYEANLKSSSVATVRTDLPSEVLALAERCGVRTDRSARFVQFAERGQMWSGPNAKPTRFSAVQTSTVSEPGFLWRADYGPGGLIKVADYLVGRSGGLEARILGTFAVAKEIDSVQAIQGEAMRYLAELPWNPDAILFNHKLDWVVVDQRTLRVGIGAGPVRAEVILALDDNGMVTRAGAAKRPRLEGKSYVFRPWWGRYWNYGPVGGRVLPMNGEVAWTIGETAFVYWRGEVIKWVAR